jgi:EAL domain-containing protein (putative c-di-GMP-specific phosphodiesterase class I)
MLLDKGLVEMISSMLSIWNAPPQMLTLEITESAIMTDVDASFATMNQIKELGASISIDDFGTGYSSFSYFKSIPADELKIDRAFVAGMTENQADQHIVEMITSLAHRFKLKVVAEGIEDEKTLDALRELKCDIGQGYYIARPMPQSQLEPWLDAQLY